VERRFRFLRGKQGYSGENVLQIRQLCITSLLLVSGIASAASVRLQVEGLSGELEKTSELNFLRSRATKSRRIAAFVRASMMRFAKG
jgi:hypothetical protein